MAQRVAERASVSEVHRYPPRPEGFEEPLFPTAASRRAVGEHLLEAPWLFRASELGGRCGEPAMPTVSGGSARALREPVEVGRFRGGRVVRRQERRSRGWRCRPGRRRVVEVLDRWREVGGWWDEGGGTDRVVFRVLLDGPGEAGGAVVDLAREASGWFLVGVMD